MTRLWIELTVPSLSKVASRLSSPPSGAAIARAALVSTPAGLLLTMRLLAATTATDSGSLTTRLLLSSNRPVIRLRV